MFWKKDTSKKEPPTSRQDYEKLGKELVSLYDTVNPNRAAVYRTALIRGILTGVGSVVGATVVVALLLWILSLFNNVPLVGGFVESIQSTVEEKQ